MKERDNQTKLMFSKESKGVLQDLFTRYPPDDGESGEKLVAKHGGKNDKKRGKRDDIFCKPSINKAEIAKKVESLASMIEKDANLRQVLPDFPDHLEIYGFSWLDAVP